MKVKINSLGELWIHAEDDMETFIITEVLGLGDRGDTAIVTREYEFANDTCGLVIRPKKDIK